MADHQLARTLSQEEADSIVTFLKALTGDIPTEYIKEPPLPKSTAQTPKPDKA
jgi:cytochrome c peroxidase